MGGPKNGMHGSDLPIRTVGGHYICYGGYTNLIPLSLRNFRFCLSRLSIMSSKRGRKRNDNLPPNRARDVQRAFRARRAAHLQVCNFPSQKHIIFIHNYISLHPKFLAQIGIRAARVRVRGGE